MDCVVDDGGDEQSRQRSRRSGKPAMFKKSREADDVQEETAEEEQRPREWRV